MLTRTEEILSKGGDKEHVKPADLIWAVYTETRPSQGKEGRCCTHIPQFAVASGTQQDLEMLMDGMGGKTNYSDLSVTGNESIKV